MKNISYIYKCAFNQILKGEKVFWLIVFMILTPLLIILMLCRIGLNKLFTWLADITSF